jgi:N-acetylated-alpha-linked acidic dipeptidase
LNIGYGGEEEYGQYHSIYDSFDHYIKFMDPTFIYGVALAKTGGRTMLRLANADLLPFEFTGFSDNISKYVKGLQDLSDKMREDNLERTRRLRDKTYEAYFDPTKKFVAPESEEPVPHLNFAPLENAATRLDKSAQDYKKAYEDASAELADSNAQRLNEILLMSERALTRKEGLPGRPWFMHQIYAPGIYTGYDPKPLPSISEAIEQKKWKVAEEQIVVVADTLNKFSDEIDRAIALLKPAK